MSKPIQGSQYTIIPGDNLSSIAGAAYGDPRKWRVIWKANQSRLRSGDPNLIFPGEVITIPLDKEEQTLKRVLRGRSLAGKDPDDFTLVIDGQEFVVMSARATRTINTASDGWTAVLAWDLEDREAVAALRPYKYPKASVYLGGELIIDGILYGISPKSTIDSRVIALEGFSFTADLIDSTIRPPYEFSQITIQKLAQDLCDPYGISVVYDLGDVEPFKRVTADPSDTVLSFLAPLVSQRGGLVSSTVDGDLLITKAEFGSPVGTLTEGKPPLREIGITFDGRKRFNVYRAIAQSPKRNSKPAVAKDDVVPKSRFLTFTADDTTAGNIQAAANWRRSKQLAEALKFSVPVDSWYDPNGNLWRENTLITVESPTIFVPDGFDFLIESVEYTFENDGITASLNLVPPQVYTGEQIEEPWL